MSVNNLEFELNRTIHLPQLPELRHRLIEKLNEYKQRIEHFKKRYREKKTGVIIDRNNNLLDAMYKSELVSELLENGHVNIGQFYEKLQNNFEGYVSEDIFSNAISVIDDYLRTGGSHTEGGSGFFTNELLQKLLHDSDIIECPDDPVIRAKLKSKYHEYIGRNVDFEQSSESTLDRAAMKRNSYKIRLMAELQKDKRLILEELVQDIIKEEGKSFDRLEFYNAVSQVSALIRHLNPANRITITV